MNGSPENAEQSTQPGAMGHAAERAQELTASATQPEARPEPDVAPASPEAKQHPEVVKAQVVTELSRIVQGLDQIAAQDVQRYGFISDMSLGAFVDGYKNSFPEDRRAEAERNALLMAAGRQDLHPDVRYSILNNLAQKMAQGRTQQQGLKKSPWLCIILELRRTRVVNLRYSDMAR